MKLVIDHATLEPEKFLRENGDLLCAVKIVATLTRRVIADGRITVFTATFSEGSEGLYYLTYGDRFSYAEFLTMVETVFKLND